MSDENANLPAQVASAISGIPAKLVPSSIKAFDRLIGAAFDIPVAWLNQRKAKIEAQTQAYAAVEAAISQAVADEAGADPEIIEQALNILVRKEYRKQVNRQLVSQAAIEDLNSASIDNDHAEPGSDFIDDDWLNIFERYAEDASSERMQSLWGRVLAGEIRKPGRFSIRTLRFLSEFSQSDALTFAEFCESAFGDIAPKSLVSPDGATDITKLIYLESAGLITGADSLGLNKSWSFREDGVGFVREGNLAIIFRGEPKTKFECSVLLLTPLGQELINLLPGRDAAVVAERVANAIKSDKTKSASLAMVNSEGSAFTIKDFWK